MTMNEGIVGGNLGWGNPVITEREEDHEWTPAREKIVNDSEESNDLETVGFDDFMRDDKNFPNFKSTDFQLNKKLMFDCDCYFWSDKKTNYFKNYQRGVLEEFLKISTHEKNS